MLINDRIEARKNMLANIKKDKAKKKKSRTKKLVAYHKNTSTYKNCCVELRSYKTIIDKFICDYNKGFCSSLCVDKIKPFTPDKLNYIQDHGLYLDHYSVLFPE